MKKNIFLSGMIVLTLFSCKNNMKEAVYEGKDISEDVVILRDKVTKKATMSSSLNTHWDLYAGFSTDKIDFSKGFSGEGKGIFPLDVNDSVRSYFQLITSEGKAILAEKLLPMSGGYNFRDLGGIKNKDGKFVKWGKFIRSDELTTLTDADLKYLASIPILSVVDFRSDSEIEKSPDKIPSSVKNRYELNISPGNLNMSQDIMSDISKMNMDSIMIAINKLFVTDQSVIATYREFFSILQTENNLPVIFHCTAGKDRTGFAAAMILLALNVDEETVMKDYLSSNIYLKDKYKNIVESHPEFAPLLSVKREYLGTAIEMIKEKYGNIDDFLTQELNIDLNMFRNMYLYD